MSERIWFSTKQAALHTNKHVDTVRKALEAGELHGGQRVASGRWSIHIDCLDAWAGSSRCPRHAETAGAA